MVVCAVFVSVVATAASQESKPDAVPGEDHSYDRDAALESCVNVEGFADISVLDDQHVYFRTRGANHYLLTTELCPNMERSYRMETARLIPYGRTVCQDDGSYLVYEDRGRELTCLILTVERVQNRAEARALADSDSPLVEIREVEDIKAVEETTPVD
jgi:hypothetical protein